jgi:hypothetical protein
MSDFCKAVEHKLNEYGYEIYKTFETSNDKEFCIMTDDIMIFVDENEKSISLSFECTSKPVEVAQSIMMLNEINEIDYIYITESYIFDHSCKEYVVGEEAEEVADKMIQAKILNDYAKDQLFSHILATQKCHEC